MGAAAGLSLAATGLGVGGKLLSGSTASSNAIQQGTQAAQMDDYKATQLSDAAQFGQAQASQTDMFLKTKLMNQMGTMMAIGAAANTESNSPTNQALLARAQGQGQQQQAVQVGNLDAQAAVDQSESGQYATAAQQTLNSAYANSGSDILGGVLGGLGSVFSGISGLKFG
jgi:hypothetical protein